MTSSQHVHLTCVLRFPVYRYLYPPTHENSNDFTRLELEEVYREKEIRKVTLMKFRI